MTLKCAIESQHGVCEILCEPSIRDCTGSHRFLCIWLGGRGAERTDSPPHPDVAAVSPTSNVHVGMHVSSHWFLDWMNSCNWHLGYRLLDGSSRVVELSRTPALAGILRNYKRQTDYNHGGGKSVDGLWNMSLGLIMMVQSECKMSDLPI
jgi:hypothetical protein